MDPEATRVLHEILLAGCLDGNCYEFALALHRDFGWPMVGLMDGSVPRHVLIRDPDGVLRDVRGRLEKTEIGRPFGMRPPYDLQDITEKDILKTRPVRERSIATARQLAEKVWPELPWKSTEAARMKAFADELETLSRKHGLWIRSAIPAAPPMISEGDDMEAGYTLVPTVNCGGYQIDRRFR